MIDMVLGNFKDLNTIKENAKKPIVKLKDVKNLLTKLTKTLGERQLMVLEFLKEDGEQTARELAMNLWNRGHIPTPERNMVHPRLNELVKLGLVKVTGKKLDSDMGRFVATYEVVWVVL